MVVVVVGVETKWMSEPDPELEKVVVRMDAAMKMMMMMMTVVVLYSYYVQRRKKKSLWKKNRRRRRRCCWWMFVAEEVHCYFRRVSLLQDWLVPYHRVLVLVVHWFE